MEHFNFRPAGLRSDIAPAPGELPQGTESLFAEDLAVTELAEEYGTPSFIYSRASLEGQYRMFKEAMGDLPHLICYAVKANSNLAVLNVLARLGSGFDIVSGGELERVKQAGGDPAKTVFSGLGKTRQEIEDALEWGIQCFNVESEAELQRINEIAMGNGVRAPVSLRVNPDVDARTHPYISTGLKENKFGIASDDALKVYVEAAELPGLEITGIDCHIGSQLTSTEPFLEAVDRLLVLVDKLAAEGITLQHLDMGGGLGVVYRDEPVPQPAELMQGVRSKIAQRNLNLIVEPGRSIAANAGLFVTRVEYIKCNQHKNFAIVDGAMNDLLRPALYGVWHEIVPVEKRAGEARIYDVVGPVCESADFLGKERELVVQAGDLLAVKSAGAYGFVMSSNYNTRPRVPEIMVDGEQHHLVRKRETFAELLAAESCLPA